MQQPRHARAFTASGSEQLGQCCRRDGSRGSVSPRDAPGERVRRQTAVEQWSGTRAHQDIAQRTLADAYDRLAQAADAAVWHRVRAVGITQHGCRERLVSAQQIGNGVHRRPVIADQDHQSLSDHR